MTQQDLNVAVAEATGESKRTIAQRGFSLANPLDACFDPDAQHHSPSYLDWDALDARWREPLR